MASVNKVIVLGNVGIDPETRYSPDGQAMCRLSIATSRFWNDRNTGDRRQETEWHRVVFFGRMAEIAGQYVRKGSPLYIEGRLKTSKYTDSNGIERYSTDIIGEQLQLIGSRGGDSSSENYNESNFSNQNPSQAGGAKQQFNQTPQNTFGNAPTNRPQKPETAESSIDDLDDDIPF